MRNCILPPVGVNTKMRGASEPAITVFWLDGSTARLTERFIQLNPNAVIRLAGCDIDLDGGNPPEEDA